MRLLLYCVFDDPGRMKPEDLPGVSGQEVFLVSKDRLSAAVSCIDRTDAIPNVSTIMAYERVVESFHRDFSVIPMRYGCLFEGESQVIRFLGERSEKLSSLLGEIRGSVEMGIRVIFENVEPGLMNTDASDSRAPSPFSHCPDSGRDYLAARKAHYSQEEHSIKEYEGVIKICRDAFYGLYTKVKTEVPLLRLTRFPFRISLPSIYFLVPRGLLEDFRRVFHRLDLDGSAKLLLSGPWPPYNFVMSEGIYNLNGL